MKYPSSQPVEIPHFPSRVHAFIWRNWQLVPAERMAETIGCTPEIIVETGHRMGLQGPPEITEDQKRRSYVTVIRRNWHLLPTEQLTQLLGWSLEHLDYILREDDFLYIKLGILKPECTPLIYEAPDRKTLEREGKIAAWLREDFPEGVGIPEEPLFQFVQDLARLPEPCEPVEEDRVFTPRFCYSYFAPYGDPLLDPTLDPYPDGYLARLAQCGVNGVWLQAVLYTLVPFPWDERFSKGWRERIEGLQALVSRAKKFGIGVYLYLNEPRAMPHRFFEKHPRLRGAEDVREKNHAALCTSVPEVRDYLRDSVAAICSEVPDLAGFFSITFSENWTNCWAHAHETGLPASGCPNCGTRSPEEVLAEVNATFHDGIRKAGSNAKLIVWDWVWPREWIPGIIERLPKGVAVMSVSEWDMPLKRGGIDSVCGEYSISTIGPGERARNTWNLSRKHGLEPIAKVQAGNSWELSTAPYIPAVENVARHAMNLREEGVKGLMLSWTLGGYPSPGLEVFNEMGRKSNPSPEEAMTQVAVRRFGETLAPAAVRAWKAFSGAFSEFPFSQGVLYAGPLQTGPSNPLWEKPTGYGATMVGYPYDHVLNWIQMFPPEVFIGQLMKIADGFDRAITDLREALAKSSAEEVHKKALFREMDVAEVCSIHCRSGANQTAFNIARNALLEGASPEARPHLIETIREALESEIELSRRLHAIQSRDSRISFEASNQYMYVPMDLAEKVLNCRDLLERWIPGLG